MTLRVLGIDPGLARTGVAVVEGRIGAMRLVFTGCLETLPQTSAARRLSTLLDMMEMLVVEQRPDVAAVESLFFSNNRNTALPVAQARGVILCALGRAGVEVAEYAPNQVKEAVAGFGGARKPQVAKMACTLLGVESIPGPDDAADACAVAICHHHRARLGSPATPATRGGRLDAAVAAAQARLAGRTG